MLKSISTTIFIFLSCVTSAEVNQPNKPLKLMADEWCPYNCEPSKEPGYTVEIFQEIFKNKSQKIDYQIVDWTTAIDKTREGTNDVLVAATVGDAPDLIYPKESIGESNLCFYATPSIRWKYKGLESLKNIRLGVIKSYSYGDKLDQYIREHQDNPQRINFSIGGTPLEELSTKLINGQVDLIVENANVMAHFQKKTKKPNTIRNIGCEEKMKVYMAFSPKNPKAYKFGEEFDEGIKSLRKSGKLREILQKYSVSDWETSVSNSP